MVMNVFSKFTEFSKLAAKVKIRELLGFIKTAKICYFWQCIMGFKFFKCITFSVNLFIAPFDHWYYKWSPVPGILFMIVVEQGFESSPLVTLCVV